MFQRIRRYLAFLIVFTFSTISLTDLGVFVEENIQETAHVEQSEIDQVDEVSQAEVNNKDIEASNFQEIEGLEKQETEEQIDNDLTWSLIYDSEKAECRPEKESSLDTSLEFVAYYIHKYQELPPVYMTKKEAAQLGWFGGGLGLVSDKKSIGGDYFGNYQGLLPEKAGRSYYECDIDALGADSRGTKRLVYSNDGLMYYTEDHYETFQLLYTKWDSENLQIL